MFSRTDWAEHSTRQNSERRVILRLTPVSRRISPNTAETISLSTESTRVAFIRGLLPELTARLLELSAPDSSRDGGPFP